MLTTVLLLSTVFASEHEERRGDLVQPGRTDVSSALPSSQTTSQTPVEPPNSGLFGGPHSSTASASLLPPLGLPAYPALGGAVDATGGCPGVADLRDSGSTTGEGDHASSSQMPADTTLPPPAFARGDGAAEADTSHPMPKMASGIVEFLSGVTTDPKGRWIQIQGQDASPETNASPEDLPIGFTLGGGQRPDEPDPSVGLKSFPSN